MRKCSYLLLFLCFCSFIPGHAQEVLLNVMKEEVNIQKQELKKEDIPTYLITFRAIDKQTEAVAASMGVKSSETTYREISFVPQYRLGSYEFDNFRNRSMGFAQKPTYSLIPIEGVNNENAIREAIWSESKERYRVAVDVYQQSRTKQSINVEQDDKAPCYSDAPVLNYYDEPMTPAQRSLDKKLWSEQLKKITAVFSNNPHLMNGDANVSFVTERRYFVNSEGDQVVQNLTYARLMVNAMTKADDGMELPLYLSYFAYTPDRLPACDKVIADAKEMVETLEKLRVAPIVTPYSGPAILSGGSAGVFFHEIFGHRVEGLRMKDDSNGQTFKKMVGKPVLSSVFSVYDDPTLKQYNGEDLNGYYKYDEEGVKAERVNVVKDGIMTDFLMTRTPIDGFPKSNGHARAEGGYDAVSRQSNLIVETNDNKSDAELRAMLIDEIKKQNKEFGYYFKEVTGGLTYTSTGSANSFNVNPLVVYRVYPDGRPDELVRGVDLIGTPLAMFSNIVDGGGQGVVFTGMCGAESGSIPVTAICPNILVSKVETQRKGKSQDILPILPAPTKQNR